MLTNSSYASLSFSTCLLCVYYVSSETNGTLQQPAELSLKASGQEGQQSDHLHSSSYGRASRAGSVSRSDKEDSGLVVQVS